MLKLTTACVILCAVCAAPSYAASIGREAEAVERRQKRFLPYGGGPVDGMNNASPDGPVDAFLDVKVVVQEDDSSEEVDTLIARREQIKKSPYLDYAQIEDQVAEINSQIQELAQKHTPPPPPPPPTPLPSINPAEAGAEAAEQQQAQQSQQEEQQQAEPGISASELAAEAAEQAPPAPDASSSSGPDNSNKEDGDGNGNDNNNNNAADPPAPADPPSPPENNNNAGGGGGGEAGGQQDSGAGAADPPSTPEPVPYEPPQGGNNVDYGNEDTKS